MATLRSADGPAADPMLPLPYRIVERRQETHDTVTLALVSAGATPTPGFAPGQFTMLYAFGIGEVPISISGDPERRDRIVHTVRAVGAVTRALCAAPVGTMIGLRGPFGSAWPVEAPRDSDLLIIAGGIGLAPLRPVIYRALQQRERYRRLSILIGARSRRDLLFADELETWRERGAQVLTTVDVGDATWTGRVGVVTRLIREAEVRPHRARVMMCGPEVMMQFCIHSLRDGGFTDGDIYLTMERNMKCAIGFCGHCQYGHDFLCKDGPVLPLSRVVGRLFAREV